mmetsp:Transcript_65153/g.160430  ORF Transcript_65153/g.160430 Transcript_65153/m.160430 type:complete len:228 (+) Transcript_65153:61-744(+)
MRSICPLSVLLVTLLGVAHAAAFTSTAPSFLGDLKSKLPPGMRLQGGGWGDLDIHGRFTKLRASLNEMGHSHSPDKGAKIAGKWKKVSEQGQEDAMLQIGLNVVFRRAAALLSRLEIRVSPKKMDIITKGPVLISITESYDFDGTASKHARRDKRFGKHTGKILQANDHKVMLDLKWNDPHGGEQIDTFEIIDGGKLLHKSEIKVNENAVTKAPGKWTTYQSVYVRE